ncbi:MAG TPA: ABC transporter ATP-binding protein [Fibrobacteria bacterium]|nr:ABC transporter ATP-binding protein [Fibrobacteria bacterium]
MPALDVRDLDRSFGSTKALEGVSFSVEDGELFGLIGPDGAGKTTLFRILSTLLLADRGTAAVDGFDVVRDARKIRERVGYMPGRFSLYQDLTVEENLEFFANVFGTTVARNRHLVDDIYRHIEPFRKRKAGALSGGMKQKLALSCALIHKPSVLFLDEPTTGVDPVSRKEFWNILANLRSQRITIVVSTPYMDEAILCDRVALMDDGRVLRIDTPDGIVEGFPGPLWIARARNMHALLSGLRDDPDVESAFAFGDAHHVKPRPDAKDPAGLARRLEERGHQEVVVAPARPGIEDCFIEMLGRKVSA